MNTTRIKSGTPRSIKLSALAAAAASFSLTPLAVPAAGPLGAEFGVNTYTASRQDLPAIAMDADGDFVVAWTSLGQDGGGAGAFGDYGVYAQRYSAAGARLGPEFRVNSTTAYRQRRPAVALDADGDFVVVWQGDSAETYGYGIYARRYNAAGTPLGEELRIDTTGGSEPSVAMDVDGDFVVTWQTLSPDSDSYEIQARRYNASGTALGTSFQANTYTASNQMEPVVAVDADGDFVVAWSSFFQDNSFDGIYAQRYNAAGIAQGVEFRVNTAVADGQLSPAIAMDADGDFIVAWMSDGQDGNYSGIYAQRYSAAGAAQGAEFRVNAVTASIQTYPAVARDADGDFIVSWQSYSQDGSGYGVYARRYNAAGTSQGTEFQVNTFSTGRQGSPVVAADADGEFVIAWESEDVDGSATGVRARRYQGSENVNLAVTQYDSSDPAPTGYPLTYTLRVSNLHTPATTTGIPAIDSGIGSAHGVNIVDTLPSGYSALSTSGTGWNCTFTDTLRCGYALTLVAGAQSESLKLRLTPPATPGSQISNVAQLTANQADSSTTNNRDVETTQLVCGTSVIQFSASSYVAAENAGTLLVTATRSGGACGVAKVQVDTDPATALPGSDYVDSTGVLSWADGELGSKSFAVPLIDDGLDEIDETFRAVLRDAQGASLGKLANVAARINDNDPAPRVSFTTKSQTRGEGGGQATLTLQLSTVSGREVIVPFTRSGTATSGSDYTLAATSVSIPAGETSVSFSVALVDDTLTEAANETAIFTIGSPKGAGKGSIFVHTLNITDNDP